MSSGERRILLVGLTDADRACLLDAIRQEAGSGQPVLALSGLEEAVQELSLDGDVASVIVGGGAAVGGWPQVGIELRRMAPQAALVAVTGADAGPQWDDVIAPHERDPAVLMRVVRAAFSIASAKASLVRWAMRDPLTDLLNRRGLERVLLRQAGEQERGLGPAAALLVDCDDFKAVNDRFGLTTGDEVLRALAAVLTRSVRGSDTVARVGGDEFVVVLPGTRTWEAVEIAERIRVAAHLPLPDGDALSVSIGVRRLAPGMTSIRELMGATQDALRESKVEGKDQVRVVDEDGERSAVVRSLPPDFSDDPALPAGTVLFEFTTVPVRDLRTDTDVAWVLRPSLAREAQLAVAAHRASRASWDLRWFERALAEAGAAPVPVHVGLYPRTVRRLGAAAVRERIPPQLPLERVTLTFDDQFLTGDPGPLADALAPLVADGLTVCLELSDLGRTCLEALVLLRPARARLAPALTDGLSPARVRRIGLGRFVRVARSLGIELVAAPLDEADARILRDLGVHLFEGAPLAPPGARPGDVPRRIGTGSRVSASTTRTSPAAAGGVVVAADAQPAVVAGELVRRAAARQRRAARRSPRRTAAARTGTSARSSPARARRWCAARTSSRA
ncbi:MAG: diguanylate cyclase [Myxococcota bacterium]